MSRYRFHLSTILFGALLSTLFCANVQASTNIIITTPPVREVVVPPRGYAKCQMLPAGFYNGVWVNERRVCHYARRGTWVSGYWQCNNYKPNKGICKKWVWVPSYWAARPVVAYGPPPPVAVVTPPVPPTRVAVTPSRPPVVVTPPAPPPARVVVTPPAPANVVVQPAVHVSFGK